MSGFIEKNLIKVQIDYERNEKKINFLNLSINTNNFSVIIPNALSNSKENINFKDKQELFSVIESEIKKRKIAFDISPEIKVQIKNEEKNKLKIEISNPNFRKISLLDELKIIRRNIAKDQKLPAYIIFHDKTLIEMVSSKPKNENEMFTF